MLICKIFHTRKLNERLDKIKKQACGNGKKSCILCNDQPKFFSKFYTCKDCLNVSLFAFGYFAPSLMELV